MARDANSAVNLLYKYTLFLINFFIFVLTGAIVGLMTWVLVSKDKEVKSVYDFVLDPACDLCLAGSIAFVVSGLGWFGAFRENVFCLKAYQHAMTLLFFLEIGIVILIFLVVFYPEARETLNIYPEDSLKRAVVNYRDDPDLQDLIDSIQKSLKCCGTSNDAEGYKDWSKNEYFKCDAGSDNATLFEFCSVPYSCCKETNTGLVNYMCGKGMQTNPDRADTIYTDGCLKAMTDLMLNNVLVVGGVLIGIFIPQIVMSCLARNLTSQVLTQMAKWNRPSRSLDNH